MGPGGNGIFALGTNGEGRTSGRSSRICAGDNREFVVSPGDPFRASPVESAPQLLKVLANSLNSPRIVLQAFVPRTSGSILGKGIPCHRDKTHEENQISKRRTCAHMPSNHLTVAGSAYNGTSCNFSLESLNTAR